MTYQTLALCFGNRGFFPEKLVAAARREVQAAVGGLGMESLVLDETATRLRRPILVQAYPESRDARPARGRARRGDRGVPA
jgi:hypothetical protein